MFLSLLKINFKYTSDNLKYVQAQPFTLAGAGSSVGDATLTLQTFAQINGTLLTMTDFGTKGFGTIQPNSADFEEQIAFTGVTQNANGTATLTGVSTVMMVSPYTETPNLATPHAGGVVFVISNTAGFYDTFVNKNDDESITGLWTFSSGAMPQLDVYATPFINEQFATKKYVDLTASGGTVANDQVIVAGTAGSILAAGQVCYFDETSNNWKIADATFVNPQDYEVGMAQGAATIGNPVSGGILLLGLDSNHVGMVTGDVQYLSDTPGALSTSFGTNVFEMGYAKSATELYFIPKFKSFLTYPQRLALAGTSGTPSGTNKYVTENDTSNGVSMTASTISFTATTKTIADSGNGFVTAGFRAGDSIAITGSASNNATKTIVSVAAGAIVVAETLVLEGAGASDTLTTIVASKVVRSQASGKINQTFQQTTDANITTLTAGPTSNADALHTHTDLETMGLNSANTYFAWGVSNMDNDQWTKANVTFGTGGGTITLINSSVDAWDVIGDLPAKSGTTNLSPNWADTQIYQFEVRAQVLGVAGDHVFGFTASAITFAYNAISERVAFAVNGSTLYSSTSTGAAVTVANIAAGITVTNWNVYKIIWTPGVNAKFYVNGILKKTETLTLPSTTNAFSLGFGGTKNTDNYALQGLWLKQQL